MVPSSLGRQNFGIHRSNHRRRNYWRPVSQWQPKHSNNIRDAGLSAKNNDLSTTTRRHDHQPTDWKSAMLVRRLFSTPSVALPKHPNNEDRKVDYRSDGGLVEGVWIFCRHGDRSPGRVLSPAHRQNEEGAFWTSRLPHPDTTSAFSAYCKYYPPTIYPGTNQGEFLDTKRNPYGFLTQKGLTQLKENGHRFFNRYDNCGRHLAERNHWRWEMAQDFLAVWDVKVYSTNYVRTILSAQSFLDGLLGTHCFTPSTDRELDPEITKEKVVPNHAWVKENFHDKSREYDKHRLIPVQVRKLCQDPLNAFDRNPDMMAEFVGEVMKNKDFHARDLAAAPLAARLANIIPGLLRPHRSGISSQSPSGINWVEAADHFVCRESHRLLLSKYSNFENDDRVEQTLKAMSFQTKVHLAWRFRQWYQNKRLLAAIAAPPLREIVDLMAHTSQLQPSDTEKRPFSLYSCHDITILGLLYGVGADFLADETVLGWDYWPPYASALVFELVRTNNTAEEDANRHQQPTASTASNEFVIRILLLDSKNEPRLVDCVDLSDAPNFAKRGSGRDGLLTLCDLGQVVQQYEEWGGECARLRPD